MKFLPGQSLRKVDAAFSQRKLPCCGLERPYPCRRDKCGQFHCNIGSANTIFANNLGAKQNFLLMSHIIGNDGTSAYFASCTCCRRNSDKMWNIVGLHNVTADQVIVLKDSFTVVDT